MRAGVAMAKSQVGCHCSLLAQFACGPITLSHNTAVVSECLEAKSPGCTARSYRAAAALHTAVLACSHTQVLAQPVPAPLELQTFPSGLLIVAIA